MSTIDYQVFDELIASLRNDGCEKQAQSLHELLHEVAWTTGSELLGELGYRITAIRNAESILSCELSERTKQLMDRGMGVVRTAWPGR